jgi:hypothetical protein
MSNVALYDFIGGNRDELIRRCRVKVATRSSPPPDGAPPFDHGVPLFLDQLVQELRHGPSATAQISVSAVKHGRDLRDRGFTISQVVHDYGDVCQSITDLAVELSAPISTNDFRTLNRCLDDAIAGAVTEHSHVEEVASDGQADELLKMVQTAITAFEALQTGTIGVMGRTGSLVHSSLMSIRTLANRPSSPPQLRDRQGNKVD